LALLKDKGQTSITMDEINEYMLNMGAPQFSYDMLKAAYDTDARVNEIIKDFTQDTLELKTSEVDDLDVKDKKRDKDKVGKMAKKATNVGKKL
jgi:hypothetical protein